MLWRAGYQPRIQENVLLPAVPDGVIVGAFDPRAQAEIGIWLRLFESLDVRPRLLFVAMEWTLGSRLAIQQVLPPSRHEQIHWIFDSDRRLTDVIAPDRPERTFAAIVKSQIAQLLVVGPPTEEAWERFEALLGHP